MSETPVAGTRATTGSRSGFSPLDYVDPSPWPWLVHLLGVVNRAWMLPAVLKIRRFDLPEADAARLRAAVNSGTVAFLGPAHPEFLTDWMVDKELSRRVSPLMAHWASYEIVNASPAIRAFWLANNLIANVPGGGGKAYSVRWSRRGHGVLLHPEGTATWQAERISRLLPGIVDMALDAARTLATERDARPVHLVPVAWRLSFLGDARRGLARDLARIEQGLALPRGDRLGLAGRFAALQRNLLARQAERLGLAPPRFTSGPGAGYFAAQADAIEQLRGSLAERYGALEPDLTRAQFQLRKAIRERAATDPDGVRRDRGRLLELMRLTSFDPALYDRPRLAQERVAEVLKRTRSSLLTRGLRNAVHNTIPIAAGPRVAHVRVAEPIRVLPAGHGSGAETEAAHRDAILAEHRIRLQHTVDALASECERHEMERAIPNLLTGG